MYNITVMDQYSPAIVTVPANMSSVEINQFPYNGTSIVANREYTITVSAISGQGTSDTSDPIVVSKCSHLYIHTYVLYSYSTYYVRTYMHTLYYVDKNIPTGMHVYMYMIKISFMRIAVDLFM